MPLQSTLADEAPQIGWPSRIHSMILAFGDFRANRTMVVESYDLKSL